MKKWKKELKQVFEAPKPEGRDQFLQELAVSEMSLKNFMWTQVKYIRKWNWILDIVFFIILLFSIKVSQYNAIMILSMLSPLLALSAVCESHRSMRHGMEELELAARFPLRIIVLLRLGILGITNLLLLITACPLLIWSKQLDLIYLGVYILLPYLAACFFSLLIIRKIPGKEGFNSCCAVTLLISIGYILLEIINIPVYSLVSPAGWLGVMLLLCLFVFRECFQLSRQTEEYLWN